MHSRTSKAEHDKAWDQTILIPRHRYNWKYGRWQRANDKEITLREYARKKIAREVKKGRPILGRSGIANSV